MQFDYTLITNYNDVIEALGGWPSFDDFEVVSIFLERGHGGEGDGPFLTIAFFGFRPDVSAEDPARNESLLTMKFADVESLKISDFNHQNAINGIAVESFWLERLKQSRYRVKILQGFGVSCEFECSGIKVLSVTPWTSRQLTPE